MSELMNVSTLHMTQQASAAAMAESAKAIQEVQAMCLIARHSPRDVTQCYLSVMKELERYSLAKISMYSFPRGGGNVSGPSIRMIEMIARNFKNLKYGTKILTLGNGVAECESYCWDTEANIHKSIPFTVKLVRDTKQGPKPLTDERDIYELVANYGARRVRNCIQAMIPADIIEDAIKKIRETIEKGEEAIPFKQRVRNLLLALEKEFGITKEMVEDKYGHSVDDISKDEFVELFGIGNALKDKQAKREDYFNFVTADKTTPQEVTANAMKEKENSDLEHMRKLVDARINELLDRENRTPEAIAGLEGHLKMKLEQVKKLPPNALLSLFNVLQGL